jgi:thioredoxin 1
MATMKVTDASFEQDVLNSSEPVGGRFLGRVVRPLPHDRAGARGDRGRDAGQGEDRQGQCRRNPGIAGKLGIRSIPTLLIYKGGKQAGQKVGAAPKGELSRWIQQATA